MQARFPRSALYVVPDRGHVSSLYFPFRSPAVGVIRRFITPTSYGSSSSAFSFASSMPSSAFSLASSKVFLPLPLLFSSFSLASSSRFFGLFLAFFDPAFAVFDALFGLPSRFRLPSGRCSDDRAPAGRAAGAVATATATGQEGAATDRRDGREDRAHAAKLEVNLVHLFSPSDCVDGYRVPRFCLVPNLAAARRRRCSARPPVEAEDAAGEGEGGAGEAVRGGAGGAQVAVARRRGRCSGARSAAAAR